MISNKKVKAFLTDLGRLTQKYGLEVEAGSLIIEANGNKTVLTDLLYSANVYSGFTPDGEEVTGDE